MAPLALRFPARIVAVLDLVVHGTNVTGRNGSALYGLDALGVSRIRGWRSRCRLNDLRSATWSCFIFPAKTGLSRRTHARHRTNADDRPCKCVAEGEDFLNEWPLGSSSRRPRPLRAL